MVTPRPPGRDPLESRAQPGVLARPHVAPSQQWRARAETEDAPQPTPVVNVSIGRVEVRATHATASETRRPREAAPLMSLEDYLGRRAGGGGR
jgi:hypothetical protein